MGSPLRISALRLLLTACAAAGAPVATQPASSEEAIDPRVDQWLKRIEQRAGESTTLRAKLTYVRVQGLLGDEQRRYGTLVYDRGPPARFAVHFDRVLIAEQLELRRHRYIYDGRWLAERNEEDKIFTRYELARDEAVAVEGEDFLKLGKGPFPLPLSLRKDRVLNRFKVTLVPTPDPANGKKSQEPKNSVHLRLVPKPHLDLEASHIDLWFDRNTVLPMRVRTFEEDEETETIVNLREIETDIKIGSEHFDTSPPIDRDWEIHIKPLAKQ